MPSKTKQSKAVESLKNDVSLFSRVHIVTRNRDCDMTTFFKHENLHFLSEHGKLRFSKKSDLMSLIPMGNKCDPPNFFDAIAIDGTARIHLLPTASITIFDEYADSVFSSSSKQTTREMHSP